MPEKPFFAGGLAFSCTRCSDCCRHEPGFVFLSEADVQLLAARLQMDRDRFLAACCRWVPGGGGQLRLSLREKPNYDCVFWSRRCQVYEARPLQCRSFPFWHSLLQSRAAWEAHPCPGIGRGALHPREEIEAWLARQAAEPILRKDEKKESPHDRPGEL